MDVSSIEFAALLHFINQYNSFDSQEFIYSID